MSDTWTERLSEYIDGTLSNSERGGLEAHLAACAPCRATLEELRRVVARARALDDRPPAADLWPGIAEQIGVSSGAHRVASLEQRRERRRVSFTVPQLAAAAIALVVLSASAAWLLRRSPSAEVAPTSTAVTDRQTAMTVSAGTYVQDPRYATAVADLERTLERGRGRLDTATVRVIEKNLAIIDRAIRDAQSALAADPGNAYLNLHLADQMRRKLELLRHATIIASARS
jgi:anti-sigma factor RsiW